MDYQFMKGLLIMLLISYFYLRPSDFDIINHTFIGKLIIILFIVFCIIQNKYCGLFVVVYIIYLSNLVLINKEGFCTDQDYSSYNDNEIELSGVLGKNVFTDINCKANTDPDIDLSYVLLDENGNTIMPDEYSKIDLLLNNLNNPLIFDISGSCDNGDNNYCYPCDPDCSYSVIPRYSSCAGGNILDSDGVCNECSAGYYSTTGENECKLCTDISGGYYCPSGTGISTGVKCPAGTYRLSDASTNDCSSCSGHGDVRVGETKFCPEGVSGPIDCSDSEMYSGLNSIISNNSYTLIGDSENDYKTCTLSGGYV